jgi:hypothetical protein
VKSKKKLPKVDDLKDIRGTKGNKEHHFKDSAKKGKK